MPNLFVNIPLPAGNGAGAPVDISAMGLQKTLLLGGDFDGGNVAIQISLDGGTSWGAYEIFSSPPGQVSRQFVAQQIRTFVSKRGPNFACNCDIGSDDAGGQFAALPLPVGDGTGAPVDVSSWGPYWTLNCVGDLRGASASVEISEDGADYAPLVVWNGAGGVQQRVAFANFARTRIKNTKPSTSVDISAGAANAAGGGASSGEVSYLPDVWEMNDVQANLVDQVVPSSISQLVDHVRAIRNGSIVGIGIELTAAITAGQLTAEVSINGVGSGAIIVLGIGDDSGQAVFAPGTIDYAAGDRLGVLVTTSADYAANNADMSVWVEKG